MLTRRPEIWNDVITGYTKGSDWEYKGEMNGRISTLSNDAAGVVGNADLILICSPAHTKKDVLTQIRPHIKYGAMVGTVFGQGAFDLQAKAILGTDVETKNLTIFSLMYVPFICKVVNYGKDINLIGPKKTLYTAVWPKNKMQQVMDKLSECYKIPAEPIHSFLNLTLCPSNQIIHPGRVTGFFEKFPDQCNQVLKFKDVPLLYEGLDQRSADEIEALDTEIQNIKRAILKRFPQIQLDHVLPISERIVKMYKDQVGNPKTLKTIFNTNKGYERVPFPMVPLQGQDKNLPKSDVLVKLNHNARFFWEDLPFGLVILKDIGNIVGVSTPAITRNIIFHQKYMPIQYVDPESQLFNQAALEGTGAPSAYGITTIEELCSTSLDKSELTSYNARM